MAKLLAAAAMAVMAASSAHGSRLRHNSGPSALESALLEENLSAEDLLNTASFPEDATGVAGAAGTPEDVVKDAPTPEGQGGEAPEPGADAEGAEATVIGGRTTGATGGCTKGEVG